MTEKFVLTLNETQRKGLAEMRDHAPRAYVRESAAALLKIADGQSGRQVALHGLHKQRDPDTVYDWVRRYRAEGLRGLLVRPGRGRKPAFPPPQHPDEESARQELLSVVRRSPAPDSVAC